VFQAAKDSGRSRTHGAHNGDRTDISDSLQETLVEFASSQAHGLIDQSIS